MASEGEARIDLSNEADPIVGTELVRQLVAEWIERHDRAQYHVTGPAAALERALVGLSWLAVDHPEIAECEINPLFASADGVAAVDFHAELDTSDADQGESADGR